jgi:hypothetical protein
LLEALCNRRSLEARGRVLLLRIQSSEKQIDRVQFAVLLWLQAQQWS